MPTVIDELDRLPARIKASADRCREIEQMLTIERATRDDLIRAAIDEAGLNQKTVAQYAGLSQPHIIRILAAE